PPRPDSSARRAPFHTSKPPIVTVCSPESGGHRRPGRPERARAPGLEQRASYGQPAAEPRTLPLNDAATFERRGAGRFPAIRPRHPHSPTVITEGDIDKLNDLGHSIDRKSTRLNSSHVK